MPNGDHDEYNKDWCKERHRNIDCEFKNVWQRIKDQKKEILAAIQEKSNDWGERMEAANKRIDRITTMFWAIVLLLVANLATIIGVFVKTTSS